MASGLASFNARRNVVAPAIAVSTIQGSSISTTSITTNMISLSTLTGSTITASTISCSTLTGSTLTTSTMIGNTLTLSTLTVSSINNGPPGVAGYSTMNVSSLNTMSSITTSSITTSSITTASGYNSISNTIYTTSGLQVGIGTSSPAQTLSVYGTMSVTSASGVYNSFFIKSSSTTTDFASMYFTNNTPANAYMGLGGSAVGGNFQSNYFIQSPNSIILNTNMQGSAGTVTMFLSSNGNVGIGTASPLTSLTIQATTSSTGVGTSAYCGIHMIGGNTADYFNGITWASNNSSSTSTHAGILVQGSGAYGTKMRFYTTNYFLGGQYEKMVIDHSGNVGIGTDTPSFFLHGYGNTDGGVEQYFQNVSSGTNAYTLIGCQNNTSQLIMFLNSSTRTDDGGQNVGTIRNNAGALRLQSSGANTAGNIYITGSNGYVGIGTTNPAQLLHVNSYMTVDNQAGAAGRLMLCPLSSADGHLPYIEWIRGNTRYGYMGYNYGSAMALTSENGYALQIGYNSSNSIYVGTNTYVGILNSNPGVPLDVTGALRCRDDWYYIQGAYGMYWTSYSRGFVSPEQAGNNYGNVSTWGSSRNTWAGWGAGSKTCFMVYDPTGEFGIHDNGSTWAFYCDGSNYRRCTIGGSVKCTQTGDRLVVYVNGYDGSGSYFYVNNGGGYGIYSDERIKKNIQTISEDSSTTFIKNLQPALFCLKEEPGAYKHCTADGKETGQVSSVCNCEQSGFIAQNVLDAAIKADIPKSVCNNWYDYEQELGLPDEQRKALLGVSIVPVVSHLTNVVKSLINQHTTKAIRISSSRSKLASILSRLSALEAR